MRLVASNNELQEQKLMSQADKCVEKGHGHPNCKCSVRISEPSKTYCGEKSRDKKLGDNSDNTMRICDCIICVQDTKISLVEMKSRSNIM